MSATKRSLVSRTVFACVIGLVGWSGALALAFPVEVAVAPGNDLALTLKAIKSAKKELLINIYEMKSAAVGQAIVQKLGDGLHVEILEEGQPVGGVSKAEKDIQAEILDAMSSSRAANHYYVMTSKPDGEDKVKRRYHFDHAKYVMVDGQSLLIGSENFSENSHATASKPGNRGWETLIHDAALTQKFKKVFDTDKDNTYGDIEDLTENSRMQKGFFQVAAFFPVVPVSVAGLPDNETFDVDDVDTVFSPDSLTGLVDLIDGAKKSIDLEMMTFSSKWGSTGKKSPLLTAVESAARRGVKVRALLNDETVFQHGGGNRAVVFKSKKLQNVITADALNKFADDEDLDLEARIADVEGMKVDYIHNKGVLVDGKKVLISSINWNQNSVENNREAGVILSSSEAYDFYEPTFNQDWKVSADDSRSK